MTETIASVLTRDHGRIATLLGQARAGDVAAYAHARSALLRHIGIEEKIVLPALRAVGPLPDFVPALRRDHAAIAALLVPSPSPVILDCLEALLARHDTIEEGPEGLYAIADRTVHDAGELLARMDATAAPPLAPHFDGERAFEAIDALLARADAPRRLT